MPFQKQKPSPQQAIDDKIIDYFTSIDSRGRLINTPKDDNELHQFIELALGFNIPRKRVISHHRAPFEFVADLFFERVKNVLGFANRSGGKCLALDTPILTSEGWSTMGALEKGDFVYAPDGTQTEVLAAHDVKYGLDCFAVNIDDRETIVADADHLWEVTRAKQDYTVLLTTRQLYESLQNPPKIGYKSIYTIQLAKPLQHREIDLPIDPYVLGAWLGDGGRETSLVHGWELPVFEELKRRWAAARDVSCFREGRKDNKEGKFCLPGLLTALHSIGLSPAKFIPEIYFHASVSQRLDLLRGLLDTDGSQSKNRSKVEYCSVDGQLAVGCSRLLWSLGIKNSITRSESWCYEKRCKDRYRIVFATPEGFQPFYLPYKAERVQTVKKAVRHRIVSITPTTSVPVRCIEVSHPSHLFLAGWRLVPTHNTLAVSILNFLDTFFKPGCEIASAGATLSQAQRCYDYFDGYLDLPWFERFTEKYKKRIGHDFVEKRIQKETLFHTGSKLEILTGSEKGLRSPHPHKARLDEIDEMEWGLIQTALSMTRSEENIRGQNVFTSTRQKERGPMQRLLDEAEKKGIAVYEWNIWEAVKKCERRCVKDPKYGDCPIKPFCQGRAHHCDGFYLVDDFIDKAKLIDRSGWDSEWLNLKPAKDKLVYSKFDNTRHVMTPDKLYSMTKLYRPSGYWPRIGGLDFGSSPGHPFVYVKLFQMPNGAWLVYHEYFAEQMLLRDHAEAIRKSPFYMPGEPIYADHDRQDQLELKALGIRTQNAVKGDINVGINLIRELLNGYPPLEEPMIYVWHECQNTIAEFNEYEYNVINGKPSRQDAPKKESDHAMDAIRYCIQSHRSKNPVKYRARTIEGI